MSKEVHSLFNDFEEMDLYYEALWAGFHKLIEEERNKPELTDENRLRAAKLIKLQTGLLMNQPKEYWDYKQEESPYYREIMSIRYDFKE